MSILSIYIESTIGCIRVEIDGEWIPMSQISKTLYRLLLRQGRDMTRQSLDFRFTKPMDKDAWLTKGGAPSWVSPEPEYSKEAMRDSLPWLDPEQMNHGKVTGDTVISWLRDYFRRPLSGDETVDGRIDRAFQALRVLEEQLYYAKSGSSSCTEGVRVDVTTCFVGSQRDLDVMYDEDEDGPPKFYYSYRIRVTNQGKEPVQLLTRHWRLYDQDGKLQMEVAKGAKGVLGQTPIIKANTCFSYYSGTDMDTKGASMEGSFGLIRGNTPFEAPVASFKFLA